MCWATTEVNTEMCINITYVLSIYEKKYFENVTKLSKLTLQYHLFFKIVQE